MKKIFTLITALTLSVGLWATSIWSGSQDVHWDNPLMLEKSKFASALPGNKITITLSVNDGTNDAIEFRANGHKLPGTRFSLCQDWWETYDLFMTQDMIDSCKVYGMEIYGDNFTVTNIDLSEGKAASMKEGKAIWTGYFWVDSWSTLEVFREALDAVKDWDKYSAMRFYNDIKPLTTDNLIFLLANWDPAGVIAQSEPATDEEAATNPLKRYEGYAELDLTKVNPLAIINAVSSDRLMLQMDKQGSAAFNFTDVVLVPAPEAPEYKYTEYENWQIKYGNAWAWSDNMEKVEDGLFKLEILWEGTGINVKSDENPIKKDWFALEELVLGEEVIAPTIVDVYLRVINDETLKIGVGVDPLAPAVNEQFEDATSGLKFKITDVGEANTVKVMKNDYTGTSYTIPATVKYKDVTFAVTEIGDDAFETCESLQSVTLSEGLITIGTCAFENCSALVSINIPAGVTTIDSAAFEGCAFTSINLPASVTTLGAQAFLGCESLQSVTLSEGLITIGQMTFVNTGLTSITIPASVTEIGMYAFYAYASSALTSVTFKGTACQDNIGDNAFENVGKTTPATLTLPDDWAGSTPENSETPWYGGYFDYTAPGPTVDATGITVNGRKYGFPVRLVKEVPAE